MLLLKLLKINNNVVVYNYFPENTEDYGTIDRLSFKRGQIN